MKGAVVRAECAEASPLLGTIGNNHSCYWPTANTLCLPEELLTEVITLLRVFFAFISGNACILTNSKTILNHPYSNLLNSYERLLMFYRS